MDQLFLEQQRRCLRAQAVDVHRPAADEVLQSPDQLCRASGVLAIDGHFARQLNHRFAAGRAALRPLDGLFAAVARLDNGADDVGDDVARPLDQDAVANANVLAGDLVEVVERGGAHGRSPDFHRLQHGVGGQYTGATDIDLQAEQFRRLLAGRELHGHCAARVFAGETQAVGQVAVIDLHHHAVNLVIDVVAAGQPLFMSRYDLIQTGAMPVVGRHWKAQVAQVGQAIPLMIRQCPALDSYDVVGVEAKRAIGRLGRVQLAQGAGGRVARVHVERLTRGGTLGVQRFEFV